MNKSILFTLKKPVHGCTTCNFMRSTSSAENICEIFGKYLKHYFRCDECIEMEKDTKLLTILLNKNINNSKLVFILNINVLNEKYCDLSCKYLLDLTGCARTFDICLLFREDTLLEKINGKEFQIRCQKCLDAEKYLTEITS